MATLVVLITLAVGYVIPIGTQKPISIALGLAIGVLGGLAAAYVMGWRY